MKKIFTLLTAILLSASIGWAWDVTWSNSDFDGVEHVGYDGSNVVKIYDWGKAKPYTRIVVCFVTANGVTYNGVMYPPKGNYSVNWQEGAGRIACYQETNDYYWVYGNSRKFSIWVNSSGTIMKYYSGDFTFGEGDGGVYVTTTNLTLANNAYSSIVASNLSVAMGTAPTYYDVDVQANNSSYGTANYAYKSGYVYANNRSQEFKKNSVYTLTATPKPGCRFVCWKKGNTTISSYPDNVVDVQITGNATYTAYFEANVSNVTITLNNQSATTAGTESVSATVNSNTNLTSAISVPSKTGRHFGGYYTGTNGTGVQIIDSNGNFIASAGGNNTYLDGSKNWKYASNITLNAYWYYTISATASGNGSVSGAGNYYEGSNTNLTATPSNSDYYLYDWEKNGVSLGVCTNPLVQSITADASYTAVFSAREVVNITASDDLVLTNGGSYWSVSGAGTDGNSNNYTMNIRFDSGNLTGTFNSGVNTSNTWVQKSGSSKVYAQSISVATVTEPSTGILQIVATIIGADEKKYVITGDYTKPIVGSWANFSWDNPQHNISIGTETSTSETCSSQWSQTSRPFLWIEAIDNSKTTNNYVLLFLATTQSSQYKGYNNADISGPKKDQKYTFTDQPKQMTDRYCYYRFNSYTYSPVYCWVYQSETAIPYMYDNVETDFWDNGTFVLGRCQQSSFVANKPDPNNTSITINTSDRKFLNDYYVITTEGKNGQPFIRVYNNSDQLLVTIGAPAPTRKVTIANPGSGKTITVKDAQNNTYATGTEHRIPEGTVLTITVSTTDNTRVSDWTGTNSSDVTGSGNSYSLTVGAKDYNIAATFEADTYTITWKSEDGTSILETDNNVAYNGATTFNGTSPTKTATVQYTYTFDGWATSANGDLAYANGSTPNATANATYYAHFNATTRTYTVTIVSNNTDYGTVSHASVINVPYGTVITTNNNTISVNGTTVTATAKEFYSFVEWQNIPGTLSDDVELTAVFALPETIVLRDDFENLAQWQTDYAALLTTLTELSDDGKVAKRDVQLNRTFAAERWSTFALPFGYSLSSNQTHPFYGHVYSLVSAQYEEKGGKGYLTLNCMPNTTSIKANTPYVLITDKDAPIANPVFNNVRLTEIEENTTTVVQDVNNTGSVRFVNTLYRQRIDKIEQYGVNSKENKSVIYLSGNKLYYPGGAIYQNAFRAYFVMNYSTIYHVAPRVRLVMPNGESVEQAEEETVETKKYIENGILVIERNGMKYDAQGHIIK